MSGKQEKHVCTPAKLVFWSVPRQTTVQTSIANSVTDLLLDFPEVQVLEVLKPVDDIQPAPKLYWLYEQGETHRQADMCQELLQKYL